MIISIITVSYNSSATIESTILSVLEQVDCEIEYIIIDGGSKDDTVNIIKKYEHKISQWISESDNGIYDAMNKGLKLASGDIIGFLNADDFYNAKDILSQVCEIFKKPEVEALYGDLVYVDNHNPKKIIRYWKAQKMKVNAFLYGWMPPHPTFFVKKEIYHRLGGFNTVLRSAADYEIMLRFIHKNGIQLFYLPKVLVCMRIGGVSNASLTNRIRANKEDTLAWRLNGLKPYFFTTWLKPIRKINQFFIS